MDNNILIQNEINIEFKTNHLQLLIGIGIQILSLTSMFAISVMRPWGKRKAQKRVVINNSFSHL